MFSMLCGDISEIFYTKILYAFYIYPSHRNFLNVINIIANIILSIYGVIYSIMRGGDSASFHNVTLNVEFVDGCEQCTNKG